MNRRVLVVLLKNDRNSDSVQYEGRENSRCCGGGTTIYERRQLDGEWTNSLGAGRQGEITCD